MKISEFILKLETIKAASGDLEIIDDFHGEAFPFVTEDGWLILCGQAAMPGSPTGSSG